MPVNEGDRLASQKTTFPHNEIRRAFLDFFIQKNHVLIPNSSLIPTDPDLLFTTSGMAPISRYFTDATRAPNTRLTGLQKCFRAHDIEVVGKNKTHLTFFEMLGNWSLNDYGKEEGLRFALDLLTQKFSIDIAKLHPTVWGGDVLYPEIPPDDETHRIWEGLGIPSDRIHRLGVGFNFWGPAGRVGPCGPSSELHYDLGKNAACNHKICQPGCSCGRFSEIWNPGVFLQYDKTKDKRFKRLPFLSIDSGAGVERLAMVLQGVSSVHDTDLLAPYNEIFSEENNIKQSSDPRLSQRRAILTDHIKAVTFLSADGLISSKKKRRGQVLDRLTWRIAANSALVGVAPPDVLAVMDKIGQDFSSYYPSLQAQTTSREALQAQVTRKSVSIQKAQSVMEHILLQADDVISRDKATVLEDRYDIPIEIFDLFAEDKGLTIAKSK